MFLVVIDQKVDRGSGGDKFHHPSFKSLCRSLNYYGDMCRSKTPETRARLSPCPHNTDVPISAREEPNDHIPVARPYRVILPSGPRWIPGNRFRFWWGGPCWPSR